MSQRSSLTEISKLSKQKKRLEKQLSLIHKKIDCLYSKFNKQLEKRYPYFCNFEYFTYEITAVDFHFGDIACAYDGNDYTLSNKLFQLNNALSDIDVFNLTAKQLLKFYNILVAIHHEVGKDEFTIIENNGLSINYIIDKFKTLVESFTQKNKSNQISKKLAIAIQQFYVMIDFALYEDSDHSKLRKLYALFIDDVNDSYRKTSEIESSLRKTEDELKALSETIPLSPLRQNIKKTNIAKSVLVSLPLSVLGLLEFYIVDVIIVLIVSLIFLLISYIPILNILVEWTMRMGENTPDMFAMCAGVTIAYFVLKETVSRILKKIETQKFTFMFTGLLLILLNIVFLIDNLTRNDAILANILLIIAGIVTFCKGRNT
ncbi:MAG: hypothetical protein J6D16_00175 [Clostridia bacterium]|nr:hypothetical protein [Clostridia bacterium]